MVDVGELREEFCEQNIWLAVYGLCRKLGLWLLVYRVKKTYYSQQLTKPVASPINH